MMQNCIIKKRYCINLILTTILYLIFYNLKPTELSAQTTISTYPNNSVHYVQLVQDLLIEAKLNPTCNLEKLYCEYEYEDNLTKDKLKIKIRYFPEGNFIHINLLNLLTIEPKQKNLINYLKRLMNFNWKYATYKFEWNEATGEVRISAYLHIDYTLSSKLLKKLIFGLHKLAISTKRELLNLN